MVGIFGVSDSVVEATVAIRMGIKDFRSKFSEIAREAKEPVIVTSHDKVVGYYTPARQEPPRLDSDWLAEMEEIRLKLRAELEAKGIDVAARLKELGIEDDAPFDNPWTEGNPQSSDDGA